MSIDSFNKFPEPKPLPNHPKPEGYDSWDTPEDSYKKEAWDKFGVFYEATKAAQNVPDLIEALEDYAVMGPQGKLEAVEWFSWGEKPAFDGSYDIAPEIDKLKKIAAGGITEDLMVGEEHSTLDIQPTPVLWALERLFKLNPETEQQ